MEIHFPSNNIFKQQKIICVNTNYYHLLASEQDGILFIWRSSRWEQTFQTEGQVKGELMQGNGCVWAKENLLVERNA